MSNIVGGIYELREQIGAGGGGIAYLGWHINLKKPVVLKADKRSLKVGYDILRKEVDMLKNLSNSYIPQVYDFFEESGVVYTVIEYIDGKSFRDLLNMGQVFCQSDVIRWACQILNALNYLHNQQPYGILHGDIKPANIMLRDCGDICLIDYNIALALGEDGAVRVGYSRGYASPEHYGISYFEDFDANVYDDTEIVNGDTVIVTGNRKITEYSDDKSKVFGGIRLDVRSDIYSLGATLYHLVSGNRPEIDATKVVKLDDTVCSPELASIISKAMHPVISKRYQSADEMLQAFLEIYKNDKRSIRFRREKKIVFGALSIVALAGIISVAIGMKRQNILQQRLMSVEYSKNALQEGDKKEAISLALSALPDGNGIFDIGTGAKGQEALTDALGVYNLAASFENDSRVELPNIPLKIVSSEHNSLFAYIYHGGTIIYDPNLRKEVVRLDLIDNAKANVYFLNDNKILYTGDKGVSIYDISTGKNLWTKDIVNEIAISGDENTFVGVTDKKIFVYSVKSGELLKEFSLNIGRNLPVNNIFADNGSDIFCLNKDGSLLALSLEDGSVRIYPINSDNPKDNDIILTVPSNYSSFKGGFCDDYFGYTASKEGKSIVDIIDVKEMKQVAAYNSDKQIKLKVLDNQFILCDGSIIESIDIDLGKENQIFYLEDNKIEDFDIGERWIVVSTDNNKVGVYSKSGKSVYEKNSDMSFFDVKINGDWICTASRDDASILTIKNDNVESLISMTYDSLYVHDEARISDDLNRLILFSIYGMQIYDKKGNILSEIEFPDRKNIYDQQYRRSSNSTDIYKKDIFGDVTKHILSSDLVEGQSFLEVFWYDGTVRRYDDMDGHLISEYQIDKPSKEVYEEFRTKNYKVISSINKPTKIYSIKNNKILKVLENTDYLTYVNQIEDMLLIEYVRASVSSENVQVKKNSDISGMTSVEKYGVLLNSNLEEIARIPGLCDYSKNIFYFDDKAGNIRKRGILSLSELKEIAKKELRN